MNSGASESGYCVFDTGHPIGEPVGVPVLQELDRIEPTAVDHPIPTIPDFSAAVYAVFAADDLTSDSVEHPATIPVPAFDVMPSSTDPTPQKFDVADPVAVAELEGASLRRSALPLGLTLEGEDVDSEPPAPIV
jgi:hypothetical protein